jgi:hypothetical protein
MRNGGFSTREMRIFDSFSKRGSWVVGIALGLLATVQLLGLEAHFRPLATNRLYFQTWSSETMMQTASIEDLRDEPFLTLWHLHIQPPAYDALRAVLAYVHKSDDSMTMLRRVDRTLYLLWALLYGMTVFMVFWWLCEIAGVAFAAASGLLFSAHPAVIFYATMLDTTLLSAFLTLCLCYLLWRVKEGHHVPVSLLALHSCLYSLLGPSFSGHGC